MNQSVIRYMTAGWIVAMGLIMSGQAVLAGQLEPTPRITVYVYNWAGVEPHTLREAKEIATRVFRNAGVEAVVLDPPLPSENEQTDALEYFFVHILPPAMAKRLGLPAMALGVAPGPPEERGRKTIYVFDHIAERMAQKQLAAWLRGTVSNNVRKGQILGHAIAHEIGHVLLHQSTHAPAGLMRAAWDRQDFQSMIAGQLRFSSDEAGRVRTEVARRGIRR